MEASQSVVNQTAADTDLPKWSSRQYLDVAGVATSTREVLEFARAHPELINVKEESLAQINGKFYSLNYTEKANIAPVADWHPITLRCRGLVVFEPENDPPCFAIVPHRKFFNWPKDRELPEEVTFRRKVDGSCIHATVMKCPELTWIVGTRSSLRSPQAVLAASFLPAPTQAHLGLTVMLELIDTVADPHGETAAAAGPPGLRLLHAWQDDVKLHFSQLDGIASLLGPAATKVSQEVRTRAEFLAAFNELESASTRDEIREGWVIEDSTGELHKYKSKTWLKWSTVPMVNEQTMRKALKGMLRTGKRCPDTSESINAYIMEQFSHLSSKKFQEFPEIVASEQAQVEVMLADVVAQAEAIWEAALSALAAQLESAVGISDGTVDRTLAFKLGSSIKGGVPIIKVAFGSDKLLTLKNFTKKANANRTPADALGLFFACAAAAVKP